MVRVDADCDEPASTRNVAQEAVIADTKISAASDAGALLATDMVPLARSGNSSAFHATMSEVAGFVGASPALTGTPTAPTQAAGDNTAAIATDAFVQTAVAPALNDTGRNRLHNNGFTVNQRSYASGTALAAGAYGHDRYKAGAVGCTYTFSQTYPRCTITITAGSLQQIVEDRNVEGGTYTLSWSGTAQGRINAGTYAASPVTVTGLAAGTAITVEWNAGTVGAVQLEPGSVATPPAKRDPADDLALCQRFYQAGIAVMTAYNAAGQWISYFQPFSVEMRATPAAVNITNPTYVNASGGGASSLNQVGANFYATVTAAGNAQFVFGFNASADL